MGLLKGDRKGTNDTKPGHCPPGALQESSYPSLAPNRTRPKTIHCESGRVGIQKRDIALGWESQEAFTEEGVHLLGPEGQDLWNHRLSELERPRDHLAQPHAFIDIEMYFCR